MRHQKKQVDSSHKKELYPPAFNDLDTSSQSPGEAYCFSGFLTSCMEAVLFIEVLWCFTSLFIPFVPEADIGSGRFCASTAISDVGIALGSGHLVGYWTSSHHLVLCIQFFHPDFGLLIIFLHYVVLLYFPLPTRGEGLGWGIIFLKNKKLHTPPLPLPFMGGELHLKRTRYIASLQVAPADNGGETPCMDISPPFL